MRMSRQSKLNNSDYHSIISKAGKYKYDFKTLEFRVQRSYDNWLSDFTNADYFQQFFKDLYVIAYGILETTEVWAKADFVNTDVAHEYATSLIERILEGKWRAKVNPGEDKFSWVPYIRLNIRHTIYRKFSTTGSEKFVSLDELKEVIKEHSTEPEDCSIVEHPATVDMESFFFIELETNDSQLAQKCSKFLKLMFGDRYYTLCSKLLSLGVDDYNDIQDEELRLFTKTSLVLFKRLYESYNLGKVNTTKIDKVFNSSLYLASILSSDRDKRLYVSLDLANLYRLALSYGGEQITVPTLDDLDELVSTAKVSYEILSSNLEDLGNIRKIRDKIKNEYDVFIRFDRLAQNVRNVFNYLSTEISDPSAKDDTLIESLLALTARSDQIIGKILDRLEDSLQTVGDSGDLIKIYREMLDNLNLSLNLMTNIKNLIESRYQKEDVAYG